MKSTVLMRSLLLSAVFVGECVPTVWADAIVLRNRSSASGAVSIAEGGQVILRSEFLSPPASVTGDFTFGDTATASSRDASGTVSADIATSISPSRITAHGNVNAVASQGNVAGAGILGVSGAQIDFFLAEAHAFTYSGQFLLDADVGAPGVTPILFAGLDSVEGGRIFGDTLADFSGLLVAPGTHVIHHSGVIAPGHYVLSGALASIFEVTLAAFPNPRGALAFDVGFTLEPVPIPTPEPATLALVGTGLVCAIGRASKQKRDQRTSDASRCARDGS